jgi:hypothetical protein
MDEGMLEARKTGTNLSEWNWMGNIMMIIGICRGKCGRKSGSNWGEDSGTSKWPIGNGRRERRPTKSASTKWPSIQQTMKLNWIQMEEKEIINNTY